MGINDKDDLGGGKGGGGALTWSRFLRVHGKTATPQGRAKKTFQLSFAVDNVAAQYWQILLMGTGGNFLGKGRLQDR